ncbi:MarR family transcriptional regulator [Metallumcola ferriviriculae]|uniref:MarR family transcriptional regulator n=1 Tax=Metallumcola ferriviriculae TaxID=3039180 RepID=A0AAU0UM05_9FIRM|nr:MarR family transcriptional regulator [Desulfitibacteraceae bacterium MK1]
MTGLEDLLNLFIENAKKLFFPEEWVKLDLNFSKSEIFTMLLLDKREEITMTELVSNINSPMSTATGLIDRLVKKGYVQRDRSETDRRLVVLTLTEEGSQLIKRLKEMISEYINMIVDDLTEEEVQFLTRIILKIMQNLQTTLDNTKTKVQAEEDIKNIDIE